MGVPCAPYARAVADAASMTTVDRSAIARLSATDPVETTSSLGASGGGPASHFCRSGNSRWQQPQPGFQQPGYQQPPYGQPGQPAGQPPLGYGGYAPQGAG